MKKTGMFLLVLIVICANTTVYAQKDQAHMFTGNVLNGNYLAEMPESADNAYIQGVIDGIGQVKPGMLAQLYPGYTRGEVVAAVKGYYEENPEKWDRPVVDVLLSGCK